MSDPSDNSFLEELKRRKVVRVGLVYAAVAFAVVEAADVFVPALQLPEWLLPAIALLAVLGFPVALVLAWAFDVTPEGVRRTPDPESVDEDGARARGWLSARSLVIAVVAVGLGLAGGWLAGRSGSAEEGAADGDSALSSVAVLPFSDMSAEGDMQYFGDGMAEEILNTLAGIPELQVAGRTSSFSFRDSDQDLRSIGRALGVETILEGSIRQAGDRIRVTAQLVRAEDQIHLWSETYDRTFSQDVFAIQDDIARKISRRLRGELGVGEGSVTGTESLEAYDHYLKGREAWASRSSEGIRSAIEHFRAALDADPEYAEAWAALADAHAVAYGNAVINDYDSTMVPAVREARRALELAPDLAAAHRAWGAIVRDLPTSETEDPLRESEEALRRAVELNPSDPWAHYWLGQTLDMMGRHDEALDQARRAAELDPLALQIRTGVAQHWLVRRDYDRAAEEADRVLAIDSTFPAAIAVATVARSFSADETPELEALAAMEAPPEDAGGQILAGAVRAVGLAGLGRDAESRALLDTLPRHPGNWDAGFRARAFELMGDVDRAFQELERLHQIYVVTYTLLPWPDSAVRSDARFMEILERFGLRRYWEAEG